MPLEGHAERLRTPLGPRDRKLLGVLALVALLAVAAGGAYGLTRGDGPSNAGCVIVTVPSTMGGARVRNCGAAAASFCQTEAAGPDDILAACRRAGYAVTPKT